MVFTRIGKNEPRNTRKIAGLLAMPTQMMARGIHDTGGIGRNTGSVGSMMVSIRLDQPIATPSDTASAVAMPKPAITREMLAAVSKIHRPLLVCVLPSIANTQSAHDRSTVVGAGSSAAGSVPEREKISQPTRISTGTIHRSSRFNRSDFIARLNSRDQISAFPSQPRETGNPDSSPPRPNHPS